MGAFSDSFEAGHPAEIAVTHLQDAAHHLEALIGQVPTESVLDAVFGAFCVGK